MVKYFFILLCFFCSISMTNAQRPKIGIALAGGGAKGLAHIGILQAIDSAGLKVDYVTGTSMGSIIGGMYAVGYSGDSIETTARKIKWDELFSNAIGLNNYSMAEKSEAGKYAIELPIEKGKIQLPSGIYESEELWLKLSDIFYPVLSIQDFDKLSIPFRCIATDLEKGEPTEIGSGNIVNAIRASMAIPGIFSYIKIKDKYFVDGGTTRNYPVKNAIGMGANYVIGVNFGPSIQPVEKLKTVIDILDQLIFEGENKDNIQERALCNINITIDMSKYSTTGFDQADEIIQYGKQIGRQYYPTFKKLADSLNHQYGTIPFVKNRLPNRKTYQLDSVQVEGVNATMENIFLKNMNMNPNERYTNKKLAKKLRHEIGTRMYKYITYDFLAKNDSIGKLQFHLIPQPKTTFKFAANYETLTGFSLIANITGRNWFTPYSRNLISIGLGDNYKFLIENLMRITETNSIANRFQAYAEFQKINQYTSFTPTALYQTNYLSLEDKFLTSNNRKWMFGIGAKWEYLKISPKVFAGNFIEGTNHLFSTNFSVEYNTKDLPIFPNKGTHFQNEISYLFGNKAHIDFYEDAIKKGDLTTNPILYGNYIRYTQSSETIIPIYKKLKGILKTQAILNFGKTNPLFNLAIIGGVNPMVHNQVIFNGITAGSITSSSVAMVQFGFRYELVKSLYASIRCNEMVYDFIPKNGQNITTQHATGFGASIAYNLFIGPIEFTTVYSQRDGFGTNFSFGFHF